jgi:hypothetical protein
MKQPVGELARCEPAQGFNAQNRCLVSFRLSLKLVDEEVFGKLDFE